MTALPQAFWRSGNSEIISTTKNKRWLGLGTHVPITKDDAGAAKERNFSAGLTGCHRCQRTWLLGGCNGRSAFGALNGDIQHRPGLDNSFMNFVPSRTTKLGITALLAAAGEPISSESYGSSTVVSFEDLIVCFHDNYSRRPFCGSWVYSATGSQDGVHMKGWPFRRPVSPIPAS